MNWDVVFSLARSVGVVLMTYLVSSGTLTNDQAAQISSGVAAVVLAGYGAWKKRDAAKAVSADAVKGVSVYVDPAVAAPAVVTAARAETNNVKVIGDPT